MSEWLDIMLEEIARKKQEAAEAVSEQAERGSDGSSDSARDESQPGKAKSG